MNTFVRRTGWATALPMLLVTQALTGCSSSAEEPEVTGIGSGTEAPPTVAEPNTRPSAVEITRRRTAIREHFNAKFAALPKVATTMSSAGTVIDWVRPEGDSAAPPPALEGPTAGGPVERSALTEVEAEPEIQGPAGTLPVVRFDVDRYLESVDVPPADVSEILLKAPPPVPASNNRYYVTWPHSGSFLGSEGTFSVWKTALEDQDTSISQVAAFTQSGTLGESVEVGKIQYYGRATRDPYLFTFYTTTNHLTSGDWQGGYDTVVQGWHQVSPTKAPGMKLTASTAGAVVVLTVEVRLSSGNWWVALGEGSAKEWIGYYPRCKQELVDAVGNCTAGTLFSSAGIRDKASSLHWYGEIYDHNHPAATTTGMGSGKFSSDFANAAYFRKMSYVAPANPTQGVLLPISVPLQVTDSACYSASAVASSTDPLFAANWPNFFYYGGPGKGAPGCN